MIESASGISSTSNAGLINANAREASKPDVLCWGGVIAIVCIAPALLMGNGFDFSTTIVTPAAGAWDEPSLVELREASHALLRGSFTHTLFEWTATTFAFFTFVLSFLRSRHTGDASPAIIGLALISAGAMDAFHVLAATRLIDGVADNRDLIPFTWALCRMFNATIQLIGVSIVLIAFRRGAAQSNRGRALAASAFFILAAYGIVAYCASSETLPQTTFPHELIKRPYDLYPIALYAIGALFVFPSYLRRSPSFFSTMLVLSLIPDTATQLYMAFGSSGLHDSAFNVAHGLKAFAYAVPLAGLCLDNMAHHDEMSRLTNRLNSQAVALEDARFGAEQASHAKSEFLANMSHEIRTPLNSIIGYAELLSRPAKDPGDSEIWTRQLHRSSAHLLSLVNDILDLSKIEAGKMRVRLENHSVLEILRDVALLMRPQATEKLLSLDVELVGQVPEKIKTDAVRLRQILLNLVSNAVKFTDSGGVEIRARTCKDSATGETLLEIEVEDSGIGIDKTQLVRIFRPFTQIRTLDNDNSEGTGLGLDISSRMARLIGGGLTVKSKVHVGTTFRLALEIDTGDALNMIQPMKLDLSEVSEPPDALSGARLDGCRLLVVDDGKNNQRILRFVLEDAGACVHIADDGKAGVERTIEAIDSGNEYDLILMDVQMPVMDGLEATRLLKRRGVKTPVVAITAYATPQDRERSLEAGCIEFVTKPLIPDHLVAVVARHVDIDPNRSSLTLAGPRIVSTLVDNQRFAPLLRAYLDDIPGIIEIVEEALEQSDRATLLRSVHQLKGTARSYGFPKLGDLAEHCQQLLREDAAEDDVASLVADLICQLRAIKGD